MYFLLVFVNFSSDTSLETACNTRCGCHIESYNPVCGEGDIQYVSPCHAGCMNFNDTQDGKKVRIYMCSKNILLKLYFFNILLSVTVELLINQVTCTCIIAQLDYSLCKLFLLFVSV